MSFDIGAHLEGPNQYVKVTVRLTYLGGISKVIASSNYITFSATDVHGAYNLITPGFTLDVSRTLYVELEVIHIVAQLGISLMHLSICTTMVNQVFQENMNTR